MGQGKSFPFVEKTFGGGVFRKKEVYWTVCLYQDNCRYSVWGCTVCAPVKNVSGLIHEPCAPILAAAFVATWDNIVLFYVVVRPGLPVRLLLSEDFVLVLFLLKAE